MSKRSRTSKRGQRRSRTVTVSADALDRLLEHVESAHCHVECRGDGDGQIPLIRVGFQLGAASMAAGAIRDELAAKWRGRRRGRRHARFTIRRG